MRREIVLTVALITILATAPTRSAETPSRNFIPAGYRAVSLPMSGDQTAFIKKGDYVDALVTFDAQMKDKAKEKVTATILQHVLVLDVLKPARLEDKGAVQIIVNPNEAQFIALALRQGDVLLSLRAEGDAEMHPMEMASLRKLFR